MALKVEKVYRETVDGIEYNVTFLSNGRDTVRVYDPVRTSAQQEKRDREIRQAVAEFGRAMLNQHGEQWFREHLAVQQQG